MTPDVVLCECIARDGLQHEEAFVATERKIALIEAVARAGFRRIEATSFSHPKHVPAFADAERVLAGLPRRAGIAFKATCPNLRAVERAIDCARAGHGPDELSLLVSASESHSQRNLRATRAEQWARVERMAEAAGGHFTLVGVVSVAFGCPFEGRIDPGPVVEDVARFADLGARLVTIGDTTGLATPRAVRALFQRLAQASIPAAPVGHFHDTRGTGLSNCLAALDAGCRHLDSALGGAGGHPAGIAYGAGFTGNVVTEDLVNLLEEEGMRTDVDREALMAASRLSEQTLGREMFSRVARAGWGLAAGDSAHV